jgi:hypothetical protein
MRKAIFVVCLYLSLFPSSNMYAQSQQPASSPGLQLAAPPASPAYPYVKGYLSFIIPWVTYQGSKWTPDLKSTTTIGFPFGVLVFYSATFGFSFEITPSIAASKPAGKYGTSKTSNVLFDPGPMFRFKHGWTFIPRLAFETGGRYGITPVLNKIVARTKAVNYFLAVSAPMRAGNSEPTSIGASMQVGFIFN